MTDTDLAPPSADELSGGAPQSVVDNFNDAVGAHNDLAPPSADDIAVTSPTQTYTYGGPVTVPPPPPGDDDQIHKMLKNLSKSNLVDGDERSVLEGYIKSKLEIPEAIATMATGAVAKPVSEIAGLAAKAYDAVTGNENGDPEGFKNDVQQSLTYSPRTEGGREIVNDIGEVADKTLGAVSRFDAEHNATLAGLAGASPETQDRVYSGTQEASNQLLSAVGLKKGVNAAKAPPMRYPVINPGDLALGYDGAKGLPAADSVDRLLDAPDLKHEGSGAEPSTTPSPAAPEPASAAPGAPPAAGKQGGFVATQPTERRAGTAADTGDNRRIGDEPQDMSLTADQRATRRAAVASERAKQEGFTGDLEPEPIPGNAAAVEGEAARRDAMTEEERAAYDAQNRLPSTGETKEQLQARLDAEADARGKDTRTREEASAPVKADADFPAPVKADADFPASEAPPELSGRPDHPMRNGVPYSMISGEKAGLPAEENGNRHQALGTVLKQMGLTAAPTIGAYQGTPERGYAVQTPNDTERKTVENIGKVFGQDSVLHVDESKNAVLRYSDGRPDEGTGKMTPVTQEEALKGPAYTRDADGNHYVAKQPEEPAAASAAEPPPHVPGTESEQRNGLGDKPEQGFKTLYGPPHKFGSTEVEPTTQGQRNRLATFDRLNIDEVPNSAVTGDYGDAGTEHQTSLLKNPMGQRIAAVIDANRQAVQAHANSLIDMTGGSRGLEGATYERGMKMEAPIRGLQEHLDSAMDAAYDEAKKLGQGKLVPLAKLDNALKNETSQFELIEGGPQLLKGITTRAKELKLLGPNGELLPATVEQADAMRKSISNAYQPKFGALISGLKNVIDDDVGNAIGHNVFAKPREIRTLISNILEQPEGVSKLLQSNKGNKLGLNRQVALQDVPKYVKNLDPDQFRHYVSVVKQAAQAGVPKLRTQARAALQELRAQFANEYLAAGDKQKGQWDQVGGNKYLKQNELNMRHVFEPSEMQQFVDNDNAGRWLSKDQRYPGASAQEQNFRSKAVETAGKAMSHGVGTVAGTAAGSMIGHTLGGMVGAAAGQVVGAGAEAMGNAFAAKQAESMITKVPKAGVKVPPGQRGSFSFQNDNPLNRATTAPRNKQRGGSVTGVTERNPRSEYNANSSLAGKPKMTPEQDNILARLSGQGGRVGKDLGKQSTAGMRNKQGGGSFGKKTKPAAELPDEITNALTGPERAQLRTDTSARVLQAFHDLGPNFTHELAAAALAGQAKRGWYRNSAEAITNLFGGDAPRFAGVLAAMSPQTSVEMNLHNAIRTFINWDKAGRPKDSKAIEQIMRDSVQKKNPQDPGVLHAWVPNTIRALTHENPENLPIPVNPAAKPSAAVRKVADDYMKSTGRPYTRPEPTQVDPERAKKIADAYGAMEHNPNDPKVKKSYDAMVKETMAQYKAMKKSGLKVEFFPEDGKDPYEGNPRAAIDDIQNNNHLYVYPTKDGFGSTAGPTDNPLLKDSGEKFGKVPATHNDIFRAVHDYFGHAADGNGFRAAGEENAWRQHAAMYSDLARPAMTTETRGQNSWVNFGPHGDLNRTAKQGETVYAEQKTGLLPKEFSDPSNVGKKELQLSGPKVNSFMKNLRDNVNEVTNDAWMSTFANINPAKLGGAGNLSGPGKSPTYLALNARVRNAASMLTHLTGDKWTPAEVQETVWSFAKTAFEYAAAHGISVPEAIKSGAITDDLIRSTPDFHTLFSAPEHAGFINDSRYAANAGRVAGGESKGADSTNASEKSAAASKALRPHLFSAAERMNQVLQDRRNSGEEAPF